MEKTRKEKSKEKQKQNAATWTDNCIYTENAKAKPLQIILKDVR